MTAYRALSGPTHTDQLRHSDQPHTVHRYAVVLGLVDMHSMLYVIDGMVSLDRQAEYHQKDNKLAYVVDPMKGTTDHSADPMLAHCSHAPCLHWQLGVLIRNAY